MRFCIYCGAKHADDDRFCPECGKPIVDIDAFEKELAIPNPETVIEEEPVIEEPVVEEPIVEETPIEEKIIEEETQEVIAEEQVQEEIETPVVELPVEETIEEPVEEPKQEQVLVKEEPKPIDEPVIEEKPEKDLKLINILLIFASIACLVVFYGFAHVNDNFHFLILGSASAALINLILSIIKKTKKKTPSHKFLYVVMIVINICIIVGDLLFFLEYIR